MSSTIHFRSRYHTIEHAHGAGGKRRAQGVDIDSLRPATLTDDARDIAWRQSYKTDTLVAKSRTDDASLSILLCGLRTPEWSISLSIDDEKNHFYTECERACRMSASISHHRYESILSDASMSTMTAGLLSAERRHSLIVYVTSELDRDAYTGLDALSRQNDILIIHLFHPIEVHPEQHPYLLIDSRCIDHHAYLQAFDTHQEAVRSYLREHGIGYIFAQTTDDPILLLNHYFKHLYAR